MNNDGPPARKSSKWLMQNNKFSLPGLSGIGSFILHDIILYIQQRCCGSGKLTSHDLPGHSEIHRGLGPYGPGCSYATVYNTVV